MSDLIELEIVGRVTNLKPMLSTVSRLEREIIRATKALDQNKISQERHNKILLSAKREYSGLGLSMQQANARVIQFNNSLKQSIAAEKAATATARLAREVDSLSRKFLPLYSATQKYNRSLAEIKRANELGIISDAKRAASIRQLDAAFAGASDVINRNTGQAARSTNQLGVVAQQTGYQVGDFLVQIQSGANPMMAFGQQATQLVGVLPLLSEQLGVSAARLMGISAVLGIAIPLLTAVASFMLRSGKEAEDAADSLSIFKSSMDSANKSIKTGERTIADLAEEFGNYAYLIKTIQPAVTAASLATGFKAVADAIDPFSEKLEGLPAKFKALREEVAVLERTSEVIQDNAQQASLIANSIEVAESKIKGLAGVVGLLPEEALALGEAFDAINIAAVNEDTAAMSDALGEALLLASGLTTTNGETKDELDNIVLVLREHLELVAAIAAAQDGSANTAKEANNGFAERLRLLQAEVLLTEKQKNLGEDSSEVKALMLTQAQDSYAIELKNDEIIGEQAKKLMAQFKILQEILGQLEKKNVLDEDQESADEILAGLEQQLKLQKAINSSGEDSAAVAQVKADAERATLQTLLDNLKVTEDTKIAIMAAHDAIVDAESQTNTWASAMAGVAAQIKGIMSALSSIGGGMIENVSLNIQSEVLEAGGDLRDAAVASERYLHDIEMANIATTAAIKGTGAAWVANNVTIPLLNMNFEENIKATDRLAKATDDFNEEQKKANKATKAGGAASKRATKETEALRKEIEKLEWDADPIKKYNAELANLNTLRGMKNGLTDGAYAKAVDDLNKGLIESFPLINDVADAFSNWMSRGFKDFKGFVEDILNSFKNLLVQMAATALRNKILIPIVTGGVSGGSSSGGGVTGSLGSVAGGLGAALTAGGSLMGVSGLAGGFGAGVGMAGSALATGGLSGLTSVIGAQTAAATAAGASMAGIGAAIGAVALPLAAIAGAAVLLNKAFSRTFYGSGLRGQFTDEGADVENLSFSKGGAFRSNKTTMTPLEAEQQTALDDASNAITTSVRNMANQLGLSASVIDGFVGDSFTIWSSRQSAEETEAQLAAEFEKLANGMSDLVLTTDQYNRAGETSFQTLERLSTSLLAVNSSVDILGGTALSASLSSADAASKLVDLAGGLEAFGSKVGFVFANLMTTVEQRAYAVEVATAQLETSFGGLTLAIPETHKEFLELIRAQDLTTEAGRQAKVALLDVAQAFVTVNGTAQEAAENSRILAEDNRLLAKGLSADLRALVKSALEGLADDVISAGRDLETAANEVRGALNREIQSLRTALSDATNDLRNAFRLAKDAAMGTTEQDSASANDALSTATDNLTASFERLQETTLTTAQDRQSVAAVAFESATSGLSSSFAAEQKATRAAFQTSIDGLSEDLTGAREQLDTSKAISEALSNALNNRLFPSIDAQRQSQDDAAGYLKSLVGMGRITDSDKLQDALERVAVLSTDTFSTLADFQRVFSRTSNTITALDEQAGITLSADEQAVDLLEKQIEEMQEQSDQAVALLQRQLDNLLGINEGVLSVKDAITEFTSSQSELTNADAALKAAEAQEEASAQQLNTLLGIDTSVLSVSEAISRFEAASATAEDAQKALTAANAQVELLDNQLTTLLDIDGSVPLVGEAVDRFKIAADAASEASILLLQQQVEGIIGVDNSIMSLTGAINGFASATNALASANAAQASATKASATAQGATALAVEQVYKEMLNRGADDKGLEFWTNKVTSGDLTINEVQDFIGMSNEALTGVVPTFAGGGYTGSGARAGGLDGMGGYMAMVHPQEDIIDHTRPSPRVTNDKDSSDDAFQLRREINELRSEQRQILMDISKHTKRSYDLERKHDVEGTPPVRAA